MVANQFITNVSKVCKKKEIYKLTDKRTYKLSMVLCMTCCFLISSIHTNNIFINVVRENLKKTLFLAYSTVWFMYSCSDIIEHVIVYVTGIII